MNTTTKVSFLARLVQGAAGWQTYLYLAGAAVALVAATQLYLNHRIDKAFEQGASSVEVQQLSTDVNTLKTVIEADKESSDDIAKNTEMVQAVAGSVAQLKRMRNADATAFEERLQRAADVAVRGYASEADSNIRTVESQRDEFAADAMQAATAAWGLEDTLQGRRDALGLRETTRASRDTLRIQPATEGTPE